MKGVKTPILLPPPQLETLISPLYFCNISLCLQRQTENHFSNNLCELLDVLQQIIMLESFLRKLAIFRVNYS